MLKRRRRFGRGASSRRAQRRLVRRSRSPRKPKKWMQKIHLKKGALHRQLGIPAGKKIPLAVLRRAARAPGKLGRRARLALTFRKMTKGKTSQASSV